MGEVPQPAVMARLGPVVPRAPEAPTPAAPVAPAPAAPRWQEHTPERRPRERARPQPYRQPANQAQRAVHPLPRWQPRTPGRETPAPPRVASVIINPATGAAVNPRYPLGLKDIGMDAPDDDLFDL